MGTQPWEAYTVERKASIREAWLSNNRIPNESSGEVITAAISKGNSGGSTCSDNRVPGCRVAGRPLHPGSPFPPSSPGRAEPGWRQPEAGGGLRTPDRQAWRPHQKHRRAPSVRLQATSP